jgi:type I restriction enzyme M protein
MNQQTLSALIWSVADLLLGDFKPHEYGRVILPFTVLRRLDCVLAPTNRAALAQCEGKRAACVAYEPFVRRAAGQSFFNISSLDLTMILGDQDHVRSNLVSYIQGLSDDARDIFGRFVEDANLAQAWKAIQSCDLCSRPMLR